MSKWLKTPKTYGGKEDNEKMERMHNTPIPTKREKMKEHIKEYVRKTIYSYMCFIVILIVAGNITADGPTFLQCLSWFGIFSLFMTSIYILARKNMI